MRRIGIAMIALVLLGALLAAPAALADKTQDTTFEAPRDLLVADKRPAALKQLDEMGVRSLRVVLTWRDVAPDPNAPSRPNFDPANPKGYSWGQYDELLDAAKQRGWKVTLTISGPVPKWATAVKRDNLTRPQSAAFGAFVAAVAKHYGDEVSAWSIWNEPNQPQFLRPQFSKGKAASPAIYRGLYQAAVRALKKTGHGNDTILLGETSPRGTGKVVAPLTFLREALCLNGKYHKRKGCGAVQASGYAHHAYTTRQGPYFRPEGKNDVTIGVLSRLTSALDKAKRAGALTKRLPVYLTEFGVQSFPDDLQGVTLQQQVEYRAAAEHIAYSNPRVAAFSQYLLTDSNPTGPKQYAGFESGLLFANGKPKPSLAAFPRVISALRSGKSRVSLWGLIRPAKGATEAQITYRDKGSSQDNVLRTVKTDARGYFATTGTYKKDRRFNVTWQGKSGTGVRALTKPKG